jgi:hypothetical protein
VANIAKRDGDWRLVVDGTETQPYDFGVKCPDACTAVFDGPESLHTLIRRKGEVLRLDIELRGDLGQAP